jgi:hypothetical protein
VQTGSLILLLGAEWEVGGLNGVRDKSIHVYIYLEVANTFKSP